MITTGANQAYVNTVISLLSQGDQCVVFKPYYFNHVMAVQMTQGNEGLVVGSCNTEGIPDVHVVGNDSFSTKQQAFEW